MDPLASLIALLVLFAICVAAWGWGRAALHACRLEAQGGLAYPVALGLAALAACGGWLNLLGVAYPPMLWGLVLAGWVFAARRVWKGSVRASVPAIAGLRPELLPAGVVVAATVFLALFLLPGGAFNPGDDLQLYFTRPVRMLQSGSVGRNPFDPLGLDSLGVQAFLQGFGLLVLPLRDFNAFDGVLCFSLALALIAALGRSLGAGNAVILAALAAALLLPMLQVNVSAVYSTTALILALVPALAQLQEPAERPCALWRGAAPAGLLLAALLGLKASTLPFLVVAGALFIALCAMTQGLRAALRQAVALVGWTALFLLPWIALQAENYARWLGRLRSADASQSGVGAFFSDVRLRWVGSVLEYHVLAAIVLVLVLVGAAGALRSGDGRLRRMAWPLAAVGGGGVLVYLFNSALPLVPHVVMRYTAPVLLAALAASVLLAGRALPRAAALAAALAAPVAIAFLFAGLIHPRWSNVVNYRSVLPFPDEEMRQSSLITHWGLERGNQERLRRAQALTIPRERILALVLSPCHLLFARNPVLTASELGLGAPWLALPLAAPPEATRAFLAQHGVRYVVWDPGWGMKDEKLLEAQLAEANVAARLTARYVVQFDKSLDALSRTSRILGVEGGLIVMDLAAAP